MIVWAAVSVVAADVTDRPAPVVAHHEVVAALEGGSSGPASTTVPAAVAVPTTARAATPSTAAPAGRIPVPTPTVPGRVPTTTTVTIAPPATVPGRVVAPTTLPPVTAPPTTVATGPGTASYSTGGGVVTVACTGVYSIRLVAALPADGYQAVVLSGGPYFVQVNFLGHGHNIPVTAACVFGQPFEGTQPGSTGPPGPPGG